MTAALITPPAIEPVLLDDAKAYLRLDADDDDALVTAAITAARVHVEALTRRCLIEQSWRVYLDQWPRRRIVPLVPAPLISVESVTVYDAAGAPHVVDEDDYEVDTVSVPGCLLLSAAVPVAARQINGIEIELTAGYGPSSIDVPGPLRQAIMMLVAHWYEHRGVVGHDRAGEIPPHGFDALIAPYRILSL
ncbi:MAG TPA: head-tail connector protein [Bauldia sp.]|nr:head-tail connector protein [Bauldia sp.]